MIRIAESLVVDASAAIAVVLREESGAAIERAMKQRTLRGVRAVVPELFWIEVANILVRRYGQPMDLVTEAVATLDRLGLTTVQSGRAGVLICATLMIDHRLSAYDATYLALAKSLDAELLTLDRNLSDAAGVRAVRLDGDRIREQRIEYRLEPWVSWSGAADYLDAIREVTLREARR